MKLSYYLLSVLLVISCFAVSQARNYENTEVEIEVEVEIETVAEEANFEEEAHNNNGYDNKDDDESQDYTDSEETDASSYEQYTEEETESDSLIKEVLEYGVAQLFEKAAAKYGVSNDSLEITKINSVHREELGTKTNFKCDVDATNNDDASIEAKFVVEYDYETEEKTLGRWRYHIEYKANDDGHYNEEEAEVEFVESETEVEIEAEAEAEVEVEVVEVTDDNEGQSGKAVNKEDYEDGDDKSEDYTDDDEEENTDASYERCSEEEIENNTLIKDVLKYGVAQMFKKAADKYGISLDNVEITIINSVHKQELGTKTNFKCDVVATNNEDATIEAKFRVEYDYETEEKALGRWRYHIEYDTNNEEGEYEYENNEEGEVEVEVEFSNDLEYENEFENSN